ncbi:MAG: SHOCT domain-containing protein [Alphaproteobacteria bacterium]
MLALGCGQKTESEMRIKRNLSTFLVAAGAAMAPLHALAQQATETTRYGHGPHMWGWGGGGYGMFIGPFFMIVVLAAIIALVVLLVRWLGGPWSVAQSSRQLQAGRALDILKERYARGEIDKEEFEARRRVLGD